MIRSWRDATLTAAVVVSTLAAAVMTTIRVRQLLLASERTQTIARVTEWREVGLAGNRMGPSQAPVTIVEFSDFLCPYCAAQAPVLRSIRSDFPEDVAVVYRHFPTDSLYGRAAAIASECAAREGIFEAFHDVLFANSGEIGTRTWASFAKEAGLTSTSGFRECLRDPSLSIIIDKDVAAARELGVVVTPTLLINGLLVHGYIDGDSLSAYVRAALDVAADPSGATDGR